MAHFLITYDLIQPGQNYNQLIEEIKNISGIYCSPCLSTWIVRSDLSANEITSRLNAIDATDRLLVIEVTSNWWSFGLRQNNVDWMKAHL